jgi:hypothetical protein
MPVTTGRRLLLLGGAPCRCHCNVAVQACIIKASFSRAYAYVVNFGNFCLRPWHWQVPWEVSKFKMNLEQYGTHHSYVLVVHTLRVAENEIFKLDFPAKRH